MYIPPENSNDYKYDYLIQLKMSLHFKHIKVIMTGDLNVRFGTPTANHELIPDNVVNGHGKKATKMLNIVVLLQSMDLTSCMIPSLHASGYVSLTK